MTATVQAPTLRRAVMLMTASSFLVPAAGLVTAPVLARALSTAGRGELAAAIAPAGLMLAAATLGLPDALTYHLAKRPRATRPALAWASVVTVGLGLVCLLATFLALSFLSGGDAGLGRLIMLATALTIPALVVNVLRGAATGRQMWGAVAIERVIITAMRVVGFGLLFLGGHLSVMAGVLVNTVTPIVAGVVYWPLLRAPRETADTETPKTATSKAETLGGDTADLGTGADPDEGRGTLAVLVAFGSKVWLGSVASMVLARASQLLMTPLSSVEDLGLYTVASTVSDLPLIVALAIQGALYGVNSKTRDAAQLTGTARLTLFVGFCGCLVLGSSLPFWIGPLFGDEFKAATGPSLMLLASALICIPGLLAGIALSAWGRPGLRSAGLAVTLVANVISFVVLVPLFGVYGAAWTSIISNVVLASFMILAARRVLGVPATDFFLVRRSDVVRAWDEGRRMLALLPLGGRS